MSLAGEEGELAQGARGGDTGMPRIAGETARGALVSGTGDGHDVVREPGWPVNASKYSSLCQLCGRVIQPIALHTSPRVT